MTKEPMTAHSETQSKAGYSAESKTVSKTGSKSRLVAVVVTFNRLDQLKVTVDRLLAVAPTALDMVLVVDNASTDDTAAWLASQRDARLQVHRCAQNGGGAGGFEAGLRIVRDSLDPDWVVVMDDDARPLPGALEHFMSTPRDDTQALAAAVYFPDGRICEMNRPSCNPFWRPTVFLDTLWRSLRGKGRDGYHIPKESYEAQTSREIDLTSFVGLFLSRRMLAQVGLPDGRLFLYGDDVIYTLKLRQQGFRIHFDPSVAFEHDCSTFENDQKRVFHPLWKVYYTYRNGLLMYRLAAGPLFWLLLPMAALKWTLVGRRYGADRPIYNRLLRRALRDAVLRDLRLRFPEVKALAACDAGLAMAENEPVIAPQQHNPEKERDQTG